MIKFTGGCLIVLLAMPASPVRSQDADGCRACCKEVYGTCKEGHLKGCDARYNDCLKECLGTPGNGMTAPKKDQPPKTNIPEIPAETEKLEKLKK